MLLVAIRAVDEYPVSSVRPVLYVEGRSSRLGLLEIRLEIIAEVSNESFFLGDFPIPLGDDDSALEMFFLVLETVDPRWRWDYYWRLAYIPWRCSSRGAIVGDKVRCRGRGRIYRLPGGDARVGVWVGHVGHTGHIDLTAFRGSSYALAAQDVA